MGNQHPFDIRKIGSYMDVLLFILALAASFTAIALPAIAYVAIILWVAFLLTSFYNDLPKKVKKSLNRSKK